MRAVLPALLAALLALTACQSPAQVPEDGPPMHAAADTMSFVMDTTGTAALCRLPDEATFAAFERVMQTAREENLAAQPYGDVVQRVAALLLGTPYEDGLLNMEQEELVVSLAAFDCVLYIENVMALARSIATRNDSFADYAQNVQALRYRDGEVEGYCSRLHYFTDWLYDNDARGNVQQVTRLIGGVPFDKTVDFMGTHRDLYPNLADDETFACIQDMEAELATRELFYIPQDHIEQAYDQLRPGDVIATATRIDGLDVTHTGFVYRDADGQTGFIHASLTGEVKVSPDLAAYIQGNESQIGIIVARPVDPRTDQAAR